MINRKGKSAIISLSSIATFNPLPYSAEYSATKIFNHFLSEALSIEFQGKIDFLSVKPGYVQFNQIKFEYDVYWVVTPTQTVLGVLNNLGYETET